jgi:hypothetical protein
MCQILLFKLTRIVAKGSANSNLILEYIDFYSLCHFQFQDWLLYFLVFYITLPCPFFLVSIQIMLTSLNRLASLK